MKHHLFGFQADVDQAATRDWYARSAGWDCDCAHCRNFLSIAGRRALPSPVLAAVDELGIPPEKPTYVCEMHPDGDGLRYQFSYRVAGRVLRENANAAPYGARFCHEPYPYGAPGFPEPHVDLAFELTLPWTLDEPMGG